MRRFSRLARCPPTHVHTFRTPTNPRIHAPTHTVSTCLPQNKLSSSSYLPGTSVLLSSPHPHPQLLRYPPPPSLPVLSLPCPYLACLPQCVCCCRCMPVPVPVACLAFPCPPLPLLLLAPPPPPCRGTGWTRSDPHPLVSSVADFPLSCLVPFPRPGVVCSRLEMARLSSNIHLSFCHSEGGQQGSDLVKLDS